MKKIIIVIAIACLAVLSFSFFGLKFEAAITKNTPFVTVKDGDFYIGNNEFRFVGTNNYYLNYKDEQMITSLLDDAKDAGFNVIRMWGFFDGDGDSVVQNHAWMQPEQGVFSEPSWATNEFASGWDRMDFAISEAAKRDIRILLVFTNYWDDFGGINEYVGWYNEKYGYTRLNPNFARKKDFYTNAEIKGYYKEYVEYLMKRTNQYNGRAYIDDPTIFSWELMNEPRNPGIEGGKITDVTNWADEMSGFVKSLDSNHLVALGDEGYFTNRSSWDYKKECQHVYNGEGGVDFEAIMKLDDIDFGTYHLYPEAWGVTNEHLEWGNKFILDHIKVGKEVNKPVILEEFGINSTLGRNRELIYTEWLETIYQNDGAGALFWMYASIDTSDNAADGYYPDYDGFCIIENDQKHPELQVLKDYASLFSGNIIGFSDNVYVLSPYTTDSFKEIESDYYENQMFPIEVKVRTSKKIKSVEMLLDGYSYINLEYDKTTNSYKHLFNLRHIYRGSNVYLDFIAHTNNGDIHSKTIEIRRLLKFDYFVNQTYTFDERYDSSDVHLIYYGSYNATFIDENWTDLNGGMLKITANHDRDHYWSEMKLEVINLPKTQLVGSYVLAYDIYFEKSKLIEGVLKPSDEAYETAPGFRCYAAIDPGWTKIGLNANNIKYYDVEEVTIDGVVYLKQNVQIKYNAGANQSKLVLGIVTNHLLYNGDYYIDNLQLYSRTLSSEALAEDDYIDWQEQRELELAARRRKQMIIIVSSGSSAIVVAGGVTAFFLIRKKKRTINKEQDY